MRSDRLLELAEIQRIAAVLADQLDDVVVGLARDGAGDRMVGLEDEPAAAGRVQLAQHLAADGLAVALFPDLDVAVAAEADAVAEAAAQVERRPCRP